MQKYLLLSFLICLFGCEKAQVKETRYLIGRDPTWSSLQIIQQKSNLNGFTNALIQRLAQVEALSLNLVDVNWAHLFQGLEEEEYVAVLTPLSPNVITSEKYLFSDPFLLLGPVLIVPAHSSATSLAELSGKIVAVNQFDDSVLVAQNYPTILIELYQNQASALENLAKGRYDALLMPLLDAQTLVPSLYGTQLKIISKPLTDKALRLVTLKKNGSFLIEHFNRGIAKLMRSGSYKELMRAFSL